MKKSQKTSKSKVDLSAMVNAAEDLQDLCGFKPPIKTEGKDEKEMIKVLADAAKFLKPSEDEEELAENTVATLKSLDLWPESDPPEEDAPEVEESEEDAPEVEEEIDNAEYSEEDAPEVEEETTKKVKKVKSTSKSSDKKESTPKPKKEKKEKKSREKTELGTTVGTGAALIDEILIKNKKKFVPVTDIEKIKGAGSKSRISTHIRHLNATGRADIEIKNVDGVVNYKLKK